MERHFNFSWNCELNEYDIFYKGDYIGKYEKDGSRLYIHAPKLKQQSFDLDFMEGLSSCIRGLDG